MDSEDPFGPSSKRARFSPASDRSPPTYDSRTLTESQVLQKSLWIRLFCSYTYTHTHHDHHGNELKNWRLSPWRPIIVMGDSNLHIFLRLITLTNRDCFPGANLRHALNILRQLDTSEDTRLVLMSFGPNDRLTRDIQYLQERVTAILSTAHKAFPNTRLIVPMINFSEDLLPNEKGPLRELNLTIKACGLPLLPDNLFSTGITTQRAICGTTGVRS